MKRRYHDDEPISPADLRRDHRLATFSFLGIAFAFALMLAHCNGVGL
jgi:hypothetical protein